MGVELTEKNSTVMAAAAYLKNLRFSNTETMNQLERIEDLHNKRLWHQVTLELLEFVKREDVQDRLVEFHAKFITDIDQRLNPLQLVEMVICVLKNVSSMEEAITMLDTLNKKISSNKVAARLIEITKARIVLENKSDEESLRKVREVVKRLSPELEKEDGVSPVHSRFYELAALYYAKQSDHEQYYRNTLRFLGCREDFEANYDSSFEGTGFKLCLAALLADNVYNFGELLQHKILDAVRGTSNGWIVELVEAFNSGNIEQVKILKPQWETQADLKAHAVKLNEKLMLSALMEAVFSRSAKDRALSFTEISNVCGLEVNKVEWLLMRCLSLGLMKGYIDQVEQTATLTWVQPRVLNVKQVQKMGDRISGWVKEVHSMEGVIYNRSKEMVSM